MHTDYWIKTTDQETWLQEAQAAGVLVHTIDIDGNEVLVPAQGISVDIVGTIYTPGQYEYNPDGTVVVLVEPIALPGFHVNIRSETEINTNNLSVIAQPKNPARVWF